MIDLTKYETHEQIYPSEIAKELGIPLLEVYEELENNSDSDTGCLERSLELMCPVCQNLSGMLFKSYWDLPRSFVCPVCNTMIDDYQTIEENAVPVFIKI